MSGQARINGPHGRRVKDGIVTHDDVIVSTMFITEFLTLVLDPMIAAKKDYPRL